MKKNSLICFRVSSELHESMAKIAKESGRSLSSTIEIVLTNYLKEKRAFRSFKNEKRQYPRQSLAVPAVVSQQGSRQMEIVSIANISLGGIGLLIRKDTQHKVVIDSQDSRFHIVFNLPTENKSLKMSCESKNVFDSTEATLIGAVFVDSDFQSYKSLQNYLV